MLGVYIGPGNIEEVNWRSCITAVENVLNSWHQRSLSLCGKALVINALALSCVWYVASLIHVPSWVVSKINSLVFQFFWSGKRDLVACNVVIQPYSESGFSVVDFQCKVWALHVQWVRRFSVQFSFILGIFPCFLVFFLMLFFLVLLLFALSRYLHFILLCCLPCASVMVLFLPVFLVLIFVLFMLFPLSPFTCIYCLSVPVPLILCPNFFLCLVPFTGLLLGGNSFISTSTVPLLI